MVAHVASTAQSAAPCMPGPALPMPNHGWHPQLGFQAHLQQWPHPRLSAGSNSFPSFEFSTQGSASISQATPAANSTWFQPSEAHSDHIVQSGCRGSEGLVRAAAISAAAQALAKRSPRNRAHAASSASAEPQSAISSGDSALPTVSLQSDDNGDTSGITVLIRGGQALLQAAPGAEQKQEQQPAQPLYPLKPPAQTNSAPVVDTQATAASTSEEPVHGRGKGKEGERWLLQTAHSSAAETAEGQGGLDAIRPPISVCVGLIRQQAVQSMAASTAAPLVHAGQAVHAAPLAIIPQYSHSSEAPFSHQASASYPMPFAVGYIGNGPGSGPRPVRTTSTSGSWSDAYPNGFLGPGMSSVSPFAAHHSTPDGSMGVHAGGALLQPADSRAPPFASALEQRCAHQGHFAPQPQNMWAAQAFRLPQHATWTSVDSPRTQVCAQGAFSATPAAAYAPAYSAAIAAASLQTRMESNSTRATTPAGERFQPQRFINTVIPGPLHVSPTASASADASAALPLHTQTLGRPAL